MQRSLSKLLTSSSYLSNYLAKWLVVSCVIGIAVGLLAHVFHLLLQYSTHFFLSTLAGYAVPKPLGELGEIAIEEFVEVEKGTRVLRPWALPLITCLGGLVVGLLVFKLAPETRGAGTDAVITAFHYRGFIRARVPLIKLISSAITIGSGGSAGTQGPIAQIGAGIGSIVASLFKLSERDRRIALAVGMGAGIGAIFKAPLGGALFGAEVLYRRDFEIEVLYPALIASVVGYGVYVSFTSPRPVFGMHIGFVNPSTLPLYAVLGVICGLLGRFYVISFYSIHKFFDNMKVPNYLKPAIGGMLTGIIGLVFPHILETSYGWLQRAIMCDFDVFEVYGVPAAATLLILAMLKMLATSLTVGSGGSGGVFAPSLVIGGFVGSSLGLLASYIYPDLVTMDEVKFMTIVGMTSFFGGVAKTPLSTMVMVLEMTGSLNLLPHAMIATVLSYLISGDYTIYRSQLATRSESPVHNLMN